MKIKVSELSGAALDWAVAKCEDRLNMVIHNGWVFVDGNPGSPILGLGYCPSTDWAQGGPLIERERIGTLWEARNVWSASTKWDDPAKVFYGKTKLITGLRCYVTSKLGAEVEVPDELRTAS